MQRLEAKSLAGLPGITHGFFGREGGVSTGLYASLNCGPGSKDDRAAVMENRRRIAEALSPGTALVSLAQIHSPIVHMVTPGWDAARHPEGDGLVTATPGFALGILTADCGPVLFADPEARVIGAAHAGWKGAIGGVIEAAVKKMLFLGAALSNITASTGPAIAQCSYEVGPEFPTPFLAQDPANAAFFFPAEAPGRHLFDLKGYAAARLAGIGLADVAVLPNDTRLENRRFFSYRRSCVRGEPDYGRQLSAILIEG